MPEESIDPISAVIMYVPSVWSGFWRSVLSGLFRRLPGFLKAVLGCWYAMLEGSKKKEPETIGEEFIIPNVEGTKPLSFGPGVLSLY